MCVEVWMTVKVNTFTKIQTHNREQRINNSGLSYVGFRTVDFGSSNSAKEDVILKGRSYTIQIKTKTGVKSYHYSLAKEDVPRTKTKEDILSQRVMPNDKHLMTSIRMLAPSRYYFPASDFSKLSCQRVLDKEEKEMVVCHMGTDQDDGFTPAFNSSFHFNLKKNQVEENFEGLNHFTSEFATWFASNQSRPIRMMCSGFQVYLVPIWYQYQCSMPELNFGVYFEFWTEWWAVLMNVKIRTNSMISLL